MGGHYPRGGAGVKGRGRTWRRGLALLSVLWVLTLLAVMAASFTRTTRTDLTLARNLAGQAEAEALADAGVHWAAAKLSLPVPDGGWWLDGQVHSLSLGEGEVRVVIADEAGKIDLNGAPRELLLFLFQAADLGRRESAALVDAVLDFRDPDSLRALNGAEDDDYAAAGRAYGAKDAPFEELAELRQVLGMTAPLYDRVAPALTVHTRQRFPDPEAAPDLVTATLLRLEEGLEEGEAGEEEAEDSEGLVADFLTGEGGSPPEGLRSSLDLYFVHAEGRTAGGAVFARDAVVRLTGSPDEPFLTFDWRQGRRSLFPLETSAED